MKLMKLLLTLMICMQALALQAQEQPNRFKLSTGLIITGIAATCMGINYASYILKSNEPKNSKKAYCNRAEQVKCLDIKVKLLEDFPHTLFNHKPDSFNENLKRAHAETSPESKEFAAGMDKKRSMLTQHVHYYCRSCLVDEFDRNCPVVLTAAREANQQKVFIQHAKAKLQKTPVIPDMNQTESAYRLSGLGVFTAISGFGLWLYGK